ncbi:hypothetical protein ANACAC_02073 [Anaerostipes caccae L1-92]|uniref:Uncharacterized protein n=1 Tax=Anaerostipes caccae (strain DSM 14662 / CCUG 47493 / JCM 13470 / NCIMB 13811 / L1-92) TaxID=411490 RepID=B0MES3_ANACD|nr:hypothetical protein ANACAC_02073 [Anaerostipes caccae L1-92]
MQFAPHLKCFCSSDSDKLNMTSFFFFTSLPHFFNYTVYNK